LRQQKDTTPRPEGVGGSSPVQRRTRTFGIRRESGPVLFRVADLPGVSPVDD